MPDWPPTETEIVELPVDELAIRLLPRLVRLNRDSMHRMNLTGSNRLHELGINSNQLHVRRAVGEAYDWLAQNGFVAEEAGILNGPWYVTRRGHTLLSDPRPLDRVRANQRIGIDLHPLIDRRVRRLFMLGELESAVLLAFREVEMQVRKLAGYSDSDLGVKLMRRAFSKNGELTDPNLDAGEQVAIMELFAGAIGAFKNPPSHRQVDYGNSTIASEAVLFADLLLRMLDKYDKAQSNPATPHNDCDPR